MKVITDKEYEAVKHLLFELVLPYEGYALSNLSTVSDYFGTWSKEYAEAGNVREDMEQLEITATRCRESNRLAAYAALYGRELSVADGVAYHIYKKDNIWKYSRVISGIENPGIVYMDEKAAITTTKLLNENRIQL